MLLPISPQGIERDLLHIRDVQGLGPVKANVNTTPLGSMDGESYTGSLVPKRNIVLTIGLNPDWDVWSMEELRGLLDLYFMPKQPTRLIFRRDDKPDAEIYGIVEGLEPNIFSKDVEVQVSIICPDPDFVAVNPTIITGIAQASATPVEVEYNGSLKTGFTLNVTYQSGASPTSVVVQLGDPIENHFQVAAPITSTKYFAMCSRPGNKYVQNVELGTGVITNLLSAVTIKQGSEWPMLEPGTNEFLVDTDVGIQDWELSFSEKFGGL